MITRDHNLTGVGTGGSFELIAETGKGAAAVRKRAVKSGDSVTLVLEPLGSLADVTIAVATRLDLATAASGRLTGRIVDARTGAPMPGLRLITVIHGRAGEVALTAAAQ